LGSYSLINSIYVRRGYLTIVIVKTAVDNWFSIVVDNTVLTVTPMNQPQFILRVKVQNAHPTPHVSNIRVSWSLCRKMRGKPDQSSNKFIRHRHDNNDDDNNDDDNGNDNYDDIELTKEVGVFSRQEGERRNGFPHPIFPTQA
jgi:hypothetical protein